MSAQSKLVIPILLEKPKFGSACTGCGWCCSTQPCALAQEFLKCTEGPCIALEHEDGRTYCGLVRRPAHYMFGHDAPPHETGQLQVMFASALGLGMGCDSDDEMYEEDRKTQLQAIARNAG